MTIDDPGGARPGRGYLIAAWITAGVGGAIVFLFLVLFAVLTLTQGWFWILIAFIASISLLGVLLCLALIAAGFVSLARARRLGPVKGQAITLTFTFIGLPASLAILAGLSGIDGPTTADAVLAGLLVVALGGAVFCASWSLWGPRTASVRGDERPREDLPREE